MGVHIHHCRPSWYTPFELLRNMAGAPAPLEGPFIILDGPPHEAPDGESVSNLFQQARASHQKTVGNVRRLYNLEETANCQDGELLRAYGINEWVNVQGRLASIIRFGFGDFDNEVRVRWSDEPNEWSAGSWCPLRSISPLTLPARFTVSREITTATNPPVQVRPDTQGYLLDFDGEGDLIIRLDGRRCKTYIYLENAESLALW